MAKNPIKQIQVPGTTPTTYDIQDNTLVAGTNITITNNADGSRSINAESSDSGITEISTQEVRIWNLDPGIYKLTYNGRKIIYYKGVSSQSGIYIGGTSGGDLLLYVSAYKTAPYKKIWHLCELKDTNNDVLLHYGWVSESDGHYETINAFNVPPKSHAATTTVYGLGTTLSYGHLKTQTGDLNGTTSTDGVAAGLGHTHSQYLTSHQSIKSLNTNNSSAQTVSSSEAIAGSGTINLHKVSKTGSYNDLLNKPDATGINYDTGPTQFSGTTVADALDDIDHILDEKGSGTVTSVAISNDTNGGLTISSGSPITSSGTIKLKHSNVLSASGTIGSSSASSGATLAVPYAKYDINGHITSKGTHTHTINNLTSSAINSGYKLPTTTEWNAKSSVTVNPSSTTNTITSIGVNGTNYQIGSSVGVAYNMATCVTPASTQAKVVTLPTSFTLATNAGCIVHFYNSNSNNNATLNVNNTGAHYIRLNGVALQSSNQIREGGIYFCRYDGNYWQLYYMQKLGASPYHHHCQLWGNINNKTMYIQCDFWSETPVNTNVTNNPFLYLWDALENKTLVMCSAYYQNSSTQYYPVHVMYSGTEYDEEGYKDYDYIEIFYNTSSTTTTSYRIKDGDTFPFACDDRIIN